LTLIKEIFGYRAQFRRPLSLGLAHASPLRKPVKFPDFLASLNRANAPRAHRP